MKITQHFDMEDPADREQLELSLNANKYVACLEEIRALIRNKTKYSENDPEVQFYKDFSELFWEILNNNDIKI